MDDSLTDDLLALPPRDLYYATLHYLVYAAMRRLDGAGAGSGASGPAASPSPQPTGTGAAPPLQRLPVNPRRHKVAPERRKRVVTA